MMGEKLNYIITIKGRAERETVIANAIAASTSPPFRFDEFRSRRYDLPVVPVSIDLPIYRMQNFRTFSDQAEYVSKEELSSDYFQAGQEIESVQQVQHEMLARLSRRGVSDDPSIYEVLKREKQREPLLITATGVVVNGNRRLAAMRELYADSSNNCSEFSHIDCAVLPADTTLVDVLDIEASLQAKTETKLDYDWIGDAQLIKAMVQQHNGAAEVCRRLNRSEREIRNTIQALAEADIYLKEWVGAPNKYSLVREDGRQLFNDLPKLIENKDVGLQHASRAIAWSLYENRDKIQGRIYNYNNAIGKLASDVLERVVDKLGISVGSKSSAPETEGFDIDFDEDEEIIDYSSVIEQLHDSETKSEAFDALIEAAQTAIEVDKGQKSGQAALKAVGQAHAKLMAVDIMRAAPDTHQAMLKQLGAIEQLAHTLIGKVKAYKPQE